MVSEALKTDQMNICTSAPKLKRTDGIPANWIIAESQVEYPDALATMEGRARAIAAGEASEAIWLVEHPPLYTAGTSAKSEDLLIPDRFPVFEAGRGGQFTYHGPGQRVAYVMLDLRERGRDIRCLVAGLENWVIDTLGAFNIKGEKRDGRIGVWVKRPDKVPFVEDKIAVRH